MPKTDIDIHPSKLFLAAILLTLCGSVLIIFTLPLPNAAKILLCVMVCFYGSCVLYRQGLLQSKNSVIKLSYADNGWQLHNHKNKMPVQLRGDSTITTALCVLRFTEKETAKKHACCIFRDSLRQYSYSRLIMLLRMTHSN